MDLSDKMSLWVRKANEPDSRQSEETTICSLENLPEIEVAEDDVDLNELFRYQMLILKSPAFDWLVSTVKRQLLLSDDDAWAMTSIREQILGGLPSNRRISRKQSIPCVHVVFRVPWDPVKFIQEQGYDGNTEELLDRIITLTGQTTDAQATTCAAYLRQTWPSTGRHMLRSLEGIVRKQATQAESRLPESHTCMSWHTSLVETY